jgi:hypothetical protein
LGVLENVLKLNDEDAKAFLEWYLSRPYSKGIRRCLPLELVEAQKDVVDFLVHRLQVPSANIKITRAEIVAGKIIIKGTVKKIGVRTPSPFKSTHDEKEGTLLTCHVDGQLIP